MNENENKVAETNVNAGGDPADVNTGQQTKQTPSPEEQKQQKEKTFDEFLADPKNQSAFDKRVAKALQTAREKWEEEAKLTDAEKETKRMSEREQALAEKEAELNRREFTTDIKSKLTAQQLPLSFAEVLAAGCTAETIDEVLGGIKTEWDKQIQEAIKAGARQKDPLAGGTRVESSAGDSLAEFARKNRKVK